MTDTIPWDLAEEANLKLAADKLPTKNEVIEGPIHGLPYYKCRACYRPVSAYCYETDTEEVYCLYCDPSFQEIRGSHLDKSLNGPYLARYIRITKAACALVEFDAIAFTGVSGALVAPAVAAALGKSLIVVRKKAEATSTHSTFSVEGPRNPVRFIVIDDFISTGKTMDTVITKVHDDLNPLSQCVGYIEYSRLPGYFQGSIVHKYYEAPIPSIHWKASFECPEPKCGFCENEAFLLSEEIARQDYIDCGPSSQSKILLAADTQEVACQD